MLFSQRKGLKEVRKSVQKDDIDDGLRYGLWDALHVCIWENIEYNHYERYLKHSNLWLLFQQYWHNYFKWPLDNLPGYFDESHTRVRKYFLECEWYEVYDFIEFTAQHCPDHISSEFAKFCNLILAREQSAFRFVDNQLTEITSDEELSSIEEAIKSTSKFSGVNAHLKCSLQLLSDRKNPDFRNSIKESISAVEALAQIIANDPKATLGAALKIIENKKAIHPALKKSLSSLYGYTSDEGGIRHAMLEENNLSYNDAKFMLVSCSAFTNYLIGKISEVGIKLNKS